jgi:hypothetical protein
MGKCNVPIQVGGSRGNLLPTPRSSPLCIFRYSLCANLDPYLSGTAEAVSKSRVMALGTLRLWPFGAGGVESG